MDFNEILDKYFTPYYEAQTVKKQEKVDNLTKKYEEMNSKLQVRKIYEVDINAEWSDQYHEIVHNYLDECPICKVENTETDIYHDLREDEDSVIQCLSCNSYLKLIDGDWYGYENPSRVILISEEEVNVEIYNKDK